MSTSDKHRPTSSQELQDYLDGKLGKKQQHAFEKKMLEDDFESEAFDGLEKLTPEEIRSDFAELNTQLNSKEKSRKINYWMAAAVFAVLISATVVLFYFVDLNKQPGIVQKESTLEDKTGSTKPEALAQDTIINTIENDTQQIASNYTDREESTTVAKSYTPPEMLAYSHEDKNELLSNEPSHYSISPIPTAEKRNSSGFSTNDGVKETQLEPVPETGSINRVSTADVLQSNDKKLNEEQFKIPSTIAYDEGIKDMPDVGYSETSGNAKAAQKTKKEKEAFPALMEQSSGFFNEVEIENNPSPYPLIGMDEYIDYLKNNLAIIPADSILHITIVISDMGKVIELKTEEKISRKQTNELEKLVVEGSGWVPAAINGTNVEHHTEIKLEW